MSGVKILVVDDHDLVRMGLVRILEDVEDFIVVGEAESGEAALERARDLQPQIVLMDIKMPGMGGIEATRRLVEENDNLRVIAVTSCEGELYPGYILQAGAAAYLSKRARPDEVITAVRMVVTGKFYISQEIAQQLALKNTGANGAGVSPFKQLSQRELQIATMIVRGEKVSVIADRLHISTKTINTYRYRIFEKLGVDTDVEVAHLAIKYKLFDVDTFE